MSPKKTVNDVRAWLTGVNVEGMPNRGIRTEGEEESDVDSLHSTIERGIESAEDRGKPPRLMSNFPPEHLPEE
jgi:hypothetical protein